MNNKQKQTKARKNIEQMFYAPSPFAMDLISQELLVIVAIYFYM